MDCTTKVVRLNHVEYEGHEIAFEIDKIRVCGRDEQPEAVSLIPALSGDYLQ